MSEHKVEVCTIDAVNKHPNADRLELVQVKGWVCVTQTGTFKPGDKCVYIPIDSVLPPPVETQLFPPDSKIKLSKSRVKTARIRGCISQGMAVPIAEFPVYALSTVGTDLAESLGIVKYEPPKKLSTRTKNGSVVKKRVQNPYFHKYTDLQHLRNYMTVFKEGEDHVVITEKIHGTNFRAGWVPFVALTWWERVKGWFGLNDEWQFVYGSRNLQLQAPKNRGKKLYYDTDVYAATVAQYDLRNRIPHGHVIYGEVYGPSIQKGYHYGLKDAETALTVFDVQTSPEGRYLDYLDARDFCERRNIPVVPFLYHGPFTQARVEKYTAGDSILAPSQKVREGVVVRPAAETTTICGRAVLKSINPEYLLSKYADEEVAHDQVS